jgi:hypothetical protein
VLAIYALGASPELIKDAYYQTHLPKLLPIPLSPEWITEKSFTENLGDGRYTVSLISLSSTAFTAALAWQVL